MLALGTSFLGFGSYTHDHDKTMGDDHHKETGSEACEPQCFFAMSLDPSLIMVNPALGGEEAGGTRGRPQGALGRPTRGPTP